MRERQARGSSPTPGRQRPSPAAPRPLTVLAAIAMTIRRRWGVLLIVAAVCLGVLVTKIIAEQVNRPIVAETFDGTTTKSGLWRFFDYATLTRTFGDTDGWLRLTDDTAGRGQGTALLERRFSPDRGVSIEFDYATYYSGRTGAGLRGADGLVVFLMDADAQIKNRGAGGTLGYSCGVPGLSTTPGDGGSCAQGTPGVTNGIVGVGFDENGVFAAREAGNGPAPGQLPDHVTIRGSGTGLTGYRYLTDAPVPEGVETGSRAGGRRVRITIANQRITVQIRYGRKWRTLIEGYDLARAPSQAPWPPLFKIGFSATCGGATNIHEIRNVTIRIVNGRLS